MRQTTTQSRRDCKEIFSNCSSVYPVWPPLPLSPSPRVRPPSPTRIASLTSRCIRRRRRRRRESAFFLSFSLSPALLLSLLRASILMLLTRHRPRIGRLAGAAAAARSTTPPASCRQAARRPFWRTDGRRQPKETCGAADGPTRMPKIEEEDAILRRPATVYL